MTQSILEEYNENIITRQTMLFKQQHIMNKKNYTKPSNSGLLDYNPSHKRLELCVICNGTLLFVLLI